MARPIQHAPITHTLLPPGASHKQRWPWNLRGQIDREGFVDSVPTDRGGQGIGWVIQYSPSREKTNIEASI